MYGEYSSVAIMTKYSANFYMGEAFLRLNQKENAKAAFLKAAQFDKTAEVVEKLEALK